MPWQKRQDSKFQSTPSVGRTTHAESSKSSEFYISIHALRGEDDASCAHDLTNNKSFQSTPSVGRTTLFCSQVLLPVSAISIHALRGEDDSKNIQICNIVFVHSAYKIIYFCDSCAFYLT